jgi:hypothetical protein
VSAGDTVSTQGSGDVFALQFARLLGAQVNATTSTTDKAERVNAVETSKVIHCAEMPDWTRRASWRWRGHIHRLLARHGSGAAGRDFCFRGSSCQRPGGPRKGPVSPSICGLHRHVRAPLSDRLVEAEIPGFCQTISRSITERSREGLP